MYIRRCSEKEREIDEHKDDESRTQRNLGFVSCFFFVFQKWTEREKEILDTRCTTRWMS